MQNVYPFVENPCELTNLDRSPVYAIMQKLNNGGKISESQEDNVCFDELWHREAYKNGIYRLMGWIFDFRPHFKKFLVNREYAGWQEHYAPDEAFIRRNASDPDEILKILEVESFDDDETA